MTARRSRSTFWTVPAVLAVLAVLAVGSPLVLGAGAAASAEGRQSTTASVPPTVAPDADGVTLNTYFLRNGKVGVGHRHIARTLAVARAATQLLLAGPTADERAAGLTSAIPTDARLRSINLANGVLTVDLSNEFAANGDARTMRQRLAQLVFTVTQFDTVKSVRVRIDGKPTKTFGTSGLTLGRALDRTTFTDETPRILVESLTPGDVVNSSTRIAGMNNTFESNVRIRIVGADGRTLADTFTTGRGPMGTWGRFEATVPFSRGANTSGKVVVFDTSAETGAETNVVEVPVRFA